MRVMIDGLQIRQGISNKTNKPYNYMMLYYRCKKNNVEGLACVNQFVSLDNFQQAANLKVGNNINIEYDENGSLTVLELAEK
jgi:hypothetical protein